MNLITKMIGFGASTVALMLLIVVLAYSNMSQMSGALSTIGEGFMPLNNAMSAVSKGQLSQSAWLERSLLAAELDITEETDRALILDDYLQEDRARGFDLSLGPLMRFALFRAGKGRYHFVWSYHHLLMDGWSLAIVLDTVFARYRHLRPQSSRH